MSYKSELAAMKYLSKVKPKNYQISTIRGPDQIIQGYQLKKRIWVGCGEASWMEWSHLHTLYFPSFLKKFNG
jgi:hypothetical protein